MLRFVLRFLLWFRLVLVAPCFTCGLHSPNADCIACLRFLRVLQLCFLSLCQFVLASFVLCVLSFLFVLLHSHREVCELNSVSQFPTPPQPRSWLLRYTWINSRILSPIPPRASNSRLQKLRHDRALLLSSHWLRFEALICLVVCSFLFAPFCTFLLATFAIVLLFVVRFTLSG